jgi:hypothetical protein
MNYYLCVYICACLYICKYVFMHMYNRQFNLEVFSYILVPVSQFSGLRFGLLSGKIL